MHNLIRKIYKYYMRYKTGEDEQFPWTKADIQYNNYIMSVDDNYNNSK